MTRLDAAELSEINAELEAAHPQDVLRWGAETFGRRLAVVTSFQPTGIATLHMLTGIAPHIAVLTLDTGLLFPETYALMDELEARLGLNLKRIKPALSVDEQEACYGSSLWQQTPNICCGLRKIVPLGEALTGYDAWMTGLRRDQSAQRRSIPIVSWDTRYDRVKISPLATWTEEMVWAYLRANDLPHNELHDRGYPSIGCAPCTQAVAAGAVDIRAGRWAGHDKIECGIHLMPAVS